MVRKLTTKASWSPTWFERQMVLPPAEDSTENQNTGKRKKTIQTNTTNEQEQLSTIHHSHTQQANKVLSKATSANEAQSTDSSMAQDIADLKERNVELMSIISEMKDFQHRDQKKIIGLESELINTNRKVDTGVKEIRECKSAIANVKTRLATLSTRAETTSRFDRIEAILMGRTTTLHTNKSERTNLLTGKRKEKTEDYDNLLESEEDESYQQTQELMEHEQTQDNMQMIVTHIGEGDQTNSHSEVDTTNTQLK
jgi:hypothetical protein